MPRTRLPSLLRSPQRVKLTEILLVPRTAVEAAAELGVPVTRLYYHLNMLLEHNIVRVVEERPKGALDERVFQVGGVAIQPSAAFLERYGVEGTSAVAAVANGAHATTGSRCGEGT